MPPFEGDVYKPQTHSTPEERAIQVELEKHAKVFWQWSDAVMPKPRFLKRTGKQSPKVDYPSNTIPPNERMRVWIERPRGKEDAARTLVTDRVKKKLDHEEGPLYQPVEDSRVEHVTVEADGTIRPGEAYTDLTPRLMIEVMAQANDSLQRIVVEMERRSLQALPPASEMPSEKFPDFTDW